MAESQLSSRHRNSQGKVLPATQKENDASAVSRFWSRVIKTSDEECWQWTGAIGNRGYGSLTVTSGGRKSKEGAHRFSFRLHFGWAGVVVMHKCDNPLCVNPKHLICGTHQDNQRDKVNKGRQAKGETQGHAKLTAEQVAEVKRLLRSRRTMKEVASLFGVTLGCISGIKYGISWKHVKGE